MFDLFIFFRPPCAGEAEQEREVSEDKVTYPLDEEGDNLNSYGGKKERIYAEHGGLLDFWDITISQRRESRNKVGDASERNKIGKNIEDEKSSCASVSPSILCCD